MARKNIARVLTVLNHQSRSRMRAEIAKAGNGHGLKRIPKQLRVKKTRAIRRRLTKHQAGAKTEKQAKKERAFPRRKYAVKA